MDIPNFTVPINMKYTICNTCFHDNPYNQIICENCNHAILITRIEDREKHMREFANFMLSSSDILPNYLFIKIRKLDINTRKITFILKSKPSDFKFLISLIFDPLTAFEIMFNFSKVWTAHCNDFGGVIDFRDENGGGLRAFLDLYATIHPDYLDFINKRPDLITPATGWKSWSRLKQYTVAIETSGFLIYGIKYIFTI